MNRDILPYYLDGANLKELVKFEERQLAPDYTLTHFKTRNTEYVLVETDYLSGMPGIVKDAERAFGVKVEGWCILREFLVEGKGALLPPESDDYDPEGTNEMNHANYKKFNFR